MSFKCWSMCDLLIISLDHLVDQSNIQMCYSTTPTTLFWCKHLCLSGLCLVCLNVCLLFPLLHLCAHGLLVEDELQARQLGMVLVVDKTLLQQPDNWPGGGAWSCPSWFCSLEVSMCCCVTGAFDGRASWLSCVAESTTQCSTILVRYMCLAFASYVVFGAKDVMFPAFKLRIKTWIATVYLSVGILKWLLDRCMERTIISAVDLNNSFFLNFYAET
jgi:hypothetical protein